ncbi:MAG: sulfite exporter TauE/SafE family protein, partial [Phycisphaerales bacterium]|nr:sulfite exporter TauE/SafE family protein [Phycisphaerales bacterium]
GGGGDKNTSATSTTTNFALWLQSLPFEPRIKFDQDIVEGGRSISVYPVILIGALVGFVASIMGVGGGFLTFPIFVYGLGISTFTTVGTDILQIIFTTSFSAITQYAIYGYVFYSLCVGMLLSLFAVQIGAMVTKVVTGSQVRAFYALTILAGFTNRLFALPRKLSEFGYLPIQRNVTEPIEFAGTIIFFGIVGFFSLWILYTFFKNFNSFRPAPTATELPGDQPISAPDRGFVNSPALAAIGATVKPPLIVRPKLFLTGTIGLLVFVLAMVLPASPFFLKTQKIAETDRPFNQAAKFSVSHVERSFWDFILSVFNPSAVKPRISRSDQAYEQSHNFDSTPVDFGISPRDVVDIDRVADILKAHNINISLTLDKRIRISGNLGEIARLAIDDAKLALEKNAANTLEKDKGVTYDEITYYWWIIFRGLTQRYNTEGQGTPANFCDFIVTRQLEPAYNFRGIDATNENDSQLFWLLAAYIIATLWYGGALYCFSEGIGISLSSSHKKSEH